MLVEAILATEEITRGEIRIYITSSRWVFRPEKYAWKAFHRLGMDATRERNGALIVLIPRRRKFFVLGDVGFSGRMEASFWIELAAQMTAHLRNGGRFLALQDGIRSLGEAMAIHWPANGGNLNELPNEIVCE